LKLNLTRNNTAYIYSLIIAILNLIWFNAATAANATEAAELVKTTTDRMLEALQQQRNAINSNPDLIYDIANRIAVPHFDFERITQTAMGKFWKQTDTDERSQLIKEFQALLIRTYAKALLNYSGQEIRLLPPRPSKRSDQVQINTTIDMQDSNPIPINYLLYLKNDAWKAYDVVINGISLVANYRNSFAQEIRRGGTAGLIEALRKRNQTTTAQ
jgi:phospholipid transport system substrate-binding protein